MMPDPNAMTDFGISAEKWKSNFWLPTSSTRYVLSDHIPISKREPWIGWHHIKFMGFYSAWGHSIDIEGPVGPYGPIIAGRRNVP